MRAATPGPPHGDPFTPLRRKSTRNFQCDPTDDAEMCGHISLFDDCSPKTPFDVTGDVDFRAALLIYLINFIDSLAGSISAPILPLYGRNLGATTEQVGQLFSVFALTQTIAMPFLGRCSDRYGRRSVLLLSLVGSAIGAAWQGTCSSYWSLVAARAFSGIWAGVSSVCQVYIADVVPPHIRGDYLSYLLSSTQASILFGPSIGAGLSVMGLNIPVLTTAVLSAAFVPIVWMYLPESPEWLLMNSQPSNEDRTFSAGGSSTPVPELRNPGVGPWATWIVVVIFGSMAFFGMVAHMSVVSMFAIFAK